MHIATISTSHAGNALGLFWSTYLHILVFVLFVAIDHLCFSVFISGSLYFSFLQE